MYGKVFSWTAAEAEEFRNATTLLREFDASEGDENYRVFLLAGADQATGRRAGRVVSSASAQQIALLHVPFYSAPPPGFSLRACDCRRAASAWRRRARSRVLASICSSSASRFS